MVKSSEEIGKRKLQAAINGFDYGGTDYVPDASIGRPAYFNHDPERYEKRVMPVKRK